MQGGDRRHHEADHERRSRKLIAEDKKGTTTNCAGLQVQLHGGEFQRIDQHSRQTFPQDKRSITLPAIAVPAIRSKCRPKTIPSESLFHIRAVFHLSTGGGGSQSGFRYR